MRRKGRTRRKGRMRREEMRSEREGKGGGRESNVFAGIYFCGIWLAFYTSGFIVNDLN